MKIKKIELKMDVTQAQIDLNCITDCSDRECNDDCARIDIWYETEYNVCL